MTGDYQPQASQQPPGQPTPDVSTRWRPRTAVLARPYVAGPDQPHGYDPREPSQVRRVLLIAGVAAGTFAALSMLWLGARPAWTPWPDPSMVSTPTGPPPPAGVQQPPSWAPSSPADPLATTTPPSVLHSGRP